MSGRGVVSFISNHSWITEPSFVVMRQRLLESFDKFWIENLHGNRKISEYAPDGRTSETVFAIGGFSVGIQQGVATSLWVKTGKPRRGPADVRFRNDIDSARAEERREQLLTSLAAKRFDAAYARAKPRAENRFSSSPRAFPPSTRPGPRSPSWQRVISTAPSNVAVGPDLHRAGTACRTHESLLRRRKRRTMKSRDSSFSDDDGQSHRRARGRKKVLSEHAFDAGLIVKYPFKVFDVRFCYLANLRPLFSEPSPELLGHRFPGNGFFITRDTADKTPEGSPFYFSPLVCDYDCISGHARHFPLMLSASAGVAGKQCKSKVRFLRAKRSSTSRRGAWVLVRAGHRVDPGRHEECRARLDACLGDRLQPGLPGRERRRPPPRLAPNPFARVAQSLKASAALGEQIAAFLDMESPMAGAARGPTSPLFRSLAVPSKVGGGALDPDGDELAVTAGWGHAGKAAVTMPAKGKLLARSFSDAEIAAIEAEAAARGMAAETLRKLLGDTTCDVFLNDVAYWRNVPAAVWKYYLGGYQVVKKWLSYRELELLGRPLTPTEVREVTNIVQRLAAIVLMQPALDDNYQRVKAATYAWQGI